MRFCTPRPVRRGLARGLLLLLPLAGRAEALVPEDCAEPASECALAEAARQAGAFVGAAISNPELPAERATIPRDFNGITAENAMKWGSLAPAVGRYDFERSDAIADFAVANDLRLRGHTLLWRDQLPADLEAVVEASPDPASKLRQLIEEHLSTVVPRYREAVSVWDVVNEPLDTFTGELDRQTLFGRTLGEAYLDEAFRRVHELDPDAQLVLNEFFFDYDLASPLGQKARGFVDLVQRLLDRGVPVHGVGVQAHFGLPAIGPLPTRAQFEGFLRTLAGIGVAIELTELDVSLKWFLGEPDPLAAQADFYGEIVGACMAVAACTAVTTWGIDDSRTWLDSFPPFDLAAPQEPLLFDGSLEPKPAYFAVRDALAAREGVFHERAARLVTAFDEALAAGDLKGREAPLRWTRNALGRAGLRLAGGHYRAACDRLDRAGRLLGDRRPGVGSAQVVRGRGTAGLAERVRALGVALDCGNRRFTEDGVAR